MFRAGISTFIFTILPVFYSPLALAQGHETKFQLCEDLLGGNSNSKSILAKLDITGFEISSIDKRVFPRFKAREITEEDTGWYGDHSEERENARGLKDYFLKVRKLRAELNKISQGTLDGIQTVIYPLAGTDSALPFLLFPDARLTIAIDNHAFSSPSRKHFSFKFSPDGLGFRDYDGIGSDSKRADEILSNLALSVPNFHLTSLSILRPPGKRGGSAFITFNQGRGTPEQYFFFVNDRVSEEVKADWWSDLIQKGSTVAVLAKGSMNFEVANFWQSMLNLSKPKRSILIGAENEIFVEPRTGLKTFKTNKVGIGYGASGPAFQKTLMYCWNCGTRKKF